jgi:hypothetical protein
MQPIVKSTWNSLGANEKDSLDQNYFAIGRINLLESFDVHENTACDDGCNNPVKHSQEKEEW